MTSFRSQDARWFFGRERAVADLLGLLADPAAAGHPAVVLGPSGVGKSSLLRAGLTPAVARGGLPGRQPGIPSVLYLTPTAQPLEELRSRGEVRPLTSHSLVVVDQFEELFTLCGDETEWNAFADELCRLAGAGLPVVAGLRADFYGHCLAHPGLREALRIRSLPLGPMNRDDLRQVITRPAAAAGLVLEPGLVEVLMRDLGSQACEAGTLPLLSHALRTTWQQRSDGVLTVAGYERTGGVHGAIATTAERAYARLASQERDAARTVLLGLVRIGQSTGNTRRRADRRELAADAAAEAVVEEFTRSRLLTADTEHVEISHEALLHAWPRLREWIEADRVSLLVRQQLTDDAAAWDAAGRDNSHLYRGTRLAVAGEWRTVRSGHSETLEGAFLAASRHHQRRKVRRMQRLMAAWAALALTAVVAAGFAVDGKREADRQTGRATAARWGAVSARLSTEADAVRPRDPGLATHLSLAAFQAAHTPQARGALIGSSAPPYATRYVTSGPVGVTAWGSSPNGRLLVEGTMQGDVRVWDTRVKRPRRPATAATADSEIIQVAVHPQQVLAAVSRRGPVRLWDLRDAHRPRHLHDLSCRQGPHCAVEFSPDGKLLAVGDYWGRLTLWDTSDPHHPRRLHSWKTRDRYVLDLAFSRDGSRLAAVAGDHEAAVWNVSNPREPRGHPIPRPRGQLAFKKVSLSPDGRVLALFNAAVSGYPVLLARVAPNGTPGRPRQLYESGGMTSFAFSADGTALAVGESRSRVRVWRVSGLWKPGGWDTAWSLTLIHSDVVVGVGFGPDGTTLAAGTRTSGSLLWHPLPPLAGHAKPVTALENSPNRKLTLTTSEDGTARLWRVPPTGAPRPLATTLDCKGLSLSGAAFSPDGHTLALTTHAPDTSEPQDKSTWAAMCLWDITEPEHPKPLGSGHEHHQNHINDAAFSPDGQTLVTGGNGDDTLVVWDIANPRRPKPKPPAPVSGVTSLTFLGTTRTLAVGTEETGVQLWNIDDSPAPSLLREITDAPSAASLATADDGSLLAAGSFDQRIYLWDVSQPAAPQLLRTLDGHRGAVLQVDLDARGKHLLTTTGIPPGPTRLWELNDPRRPRQVASIEGTTGIGVLTDRSDGFLVTTDAFTLRRWSTDTHAVVRTLCQQTGSPMTTQEHDLYDTERLGTPCP
ncbi:AAA family ATPase [Streptomyces chartreusis]|uniref:NACHT and WD repeat domain-containing protein n=1 Tax=Streptomyces chartreusis TaxID=1969 RepID=UPI0033F0510C